jgi:hypothetical protein
MRRSDELEDGSANLSRLAHGIESNMENLRALTNGPGFLPEHGEGIEMAIKVQLQLLKEYGTA